MFRKNLYYTVHLTLFDIRMREEVYYDMSPTCSVCRFQVGSVRDDHLQTVQTTLRRTQVEAGQALVKKGVYNIHKPASLGIALYLNDS